MLGKLRELTQKNTARFKFEIRSILGGYLAIYLHLMRKRLICASYVVDGDKEIMIEGFLRSGNMFAAAAFLLAQDRSVKIAHQLHAPAKVNDCKDLLAELCYEMEYELL